MKTLAVVIFGAVLTALGITLLALLMTTPKGMPLPEPAECVPEVVYQPGEPVVIPYPVKVPVPYAIADEVLGAYRVNGYVTFGAGRLGGLTMTSTPEIMACFPYYEE